MTDKPTTDTSIENAKPAPKPQRTRAEQKEYRLKKALRENLQRRKQHARAQKNES